MLLVSVIIPCFNVEKYIKECLESVIKQSYSKIEVLCIDNNSVDNTKKIICDFIDEFPEKIFLINEPKQGASFARNLGLKKAKGEWIQFLDADDLLKPNKIKHQILLLENRLKIDVIYSPSIKRKISKKEELMTIQKDIILGLFLTQLGNTCSNLFRKEKLIEINGWADELKSSQEYDLMIRLFKSNAFFYYDNNIFTIIREREYGQISNIKSKWVTYLNLRIDFYNYLATKNISYKRKYFEAIFNTILICAIHEKFKLFSIFRKNIHLFKMMNIMNFFKLLYYLFFKHSFK